MSGNLVLASGSPRRAKILRSLGVRFEILRTDAEEAALIPGRMYNQDETWHIVEWNATAKLLAGCRALGGRAQGILAADTVVWFRNRILGKPKSLAEAADDLRRLSGKVHSVFTGVAYLPPGAQDDDVRSAVVESRVTFRTLSEAAIAAYVERVKPLDRAGAYDIDESGDLIVESWSGSYENIMGLPVEPLRKWGIVT